MGLSHNSGSNWNYGYLWLSTVLVGKCGTYVGGK